MCIRDRGPLSDVALGAQQLHFTLEGGVVGASRLQGRGFLLVAVLLGEEVAQRRHVERSPDEDQDKDRQAPEMQARRRDAAASAAAGAAEPLTILNGTRLTQVRLPASAGPR